MEHSDKIIRSRRHFRTPIIRRVSDDSSSSGCRRLAEFSWCHMLRRTVLFESSAPEPPRGVSEGSMKKTNPILADDMRAEYDFASMKGGVRGKYAGRAREGTNIVLIEPEVTDAFPTEQAVNEALKGVLNTTRAVRSTGGLPNSALQPTSRRKRKAKSRKPTRAARG